MRLKPLFISLAILAIAAASSACVSQAWVTPLAPPRPVREANCPVELTVGAAPQGTENLGIVRCRAQAFSRDCDRLIQEQTCALGGDIAYGLHWEEGRDTSLVGTIGATERR